MLYEIFTQILSDIGKVFYAFIGSKITRVGSQKRNHSKQ
jgi:hypothetical protein